MSAAVSTPAVRERPILFSKPMVLALLAGRKTVTRRIVKPQPEANAYGSFSWPSHKARSMVETRDMGGLSPYGATGERLWVRETFALVDGVTHYDGPPTKAPDEFEPLYRASFTPGERAEPRWFPAIHIPRWASRITLEITDVRVERLSAITEEDARAEGVTVGEQVPATVNGKPGTACFFNARAAFAYLWNAINGERAAWATDPWVWRVGFRVLP